ncbi:MAG TPA: thioredoxin [Pseudorhodoplanes sp.]|nr:thioredoxin [Pseudorhodoplanes sp.]HWV42400.1 thioredoxin [Pseudorhodoplanes sp.]
MLQNIGEAPGAAPASDLIADTTTQTFVKDVIEESKRRPVLVDFWAPWCGPCKQLTPVLEKVVKAAKGKFKLVKMNIDEHPPIFQQIAQQMGIQSIPAVLAFVNGQPIDGFLGALPEKQITEFVERVIKDRVGGDEKDALAAADAALAGKDYAGAAELYAHVLQQDSNSIAAMAGLARCYVGTGNIEQAKKTLEMIPEAKRNDSAVAAARAAIELAEQTKDLGSIPDLEAKVATDPKDYQARFDLALALNAKGNREAAIDHLIEIVKRDRKWNDDGARKQLVQLFDAWGPTDEATLNGRKRLSSVLFA